ncbi:NYN domain-containing protein [Yoonia sp. 208BN28-4]|uniref:NYN domain-containing protein n=1 Tax=Yoonia sp. 208BN28-4 TaxID=3126505 RepID=UPI0030972168
MSNSIAVLVDGDNVSPSHARQIIAHAATCGQLQTMRVYCDASSGTGWHAADQFQVMHAGAGKNAADVLLALDALELALLRGVRHFVIASSDGDFSHVATRLRDHGAHVTGMGEAKAPAHFRAKCSAFANLGDATAGQATKGENTGDIAQLDQQIRSMIAVHSTNGEGMQIAQLAPKMHQKYAVRISTLPEKTWRGYLSARPNLFALDPKGKDARVRFLPQGFHGVAAKTTDTRMHSNPCQTA